MRIVHGKLFPLIAEQLKDDVVKTSYSSRKFLLEKLLKNIF
jgi:hypothetical protein